MFSLIIFFALPAHGQANTLPPLSPPYGEIPPTFWEQHRMSVVMIGMGVIVVAAFGVWLTFRPKLKIVVPPEAQARQALETLRGQPENGVLLIRVSQILRGYFIAAFHLPPGELTTAEFSRAVSICQQIDAGLANDVTVFLRDCDERKFSPKPALAPLGAANRGLQLVAVAEQGRVALRQTADARTEGQRA